MKKYYLKSNCKDCNTIISKNAIRCKECYFLNELNKSYIKTKNNLNKVTPNFLAWLAGFWEADGSIKSEEKQGKYYGLKFLVFQKEVSVLEIIKKKLKIGNIYGNGRNNVCSSWVLCNLGEILALLEAINPYLISNRRKTQIKSQIDNSYFKNKIKSLKRL